MTIPLTFYLLTTSEDYSNIRTLREQVVDPKIDALFTAPKGCSSSGIEPNTHYVVVGLVPHKIATRMNQVLGSSQELASQVNFWRLKTVGNYLDDEPNILVTNVASSIPRIGEPLILADALADVGLKLIPVEEY